MIKFNNAIVSQNHFPDGTLRLLDFPTNVVENENQIMWKYENDAELFTVICITKHIKNNFPRVKVSLYVPFFPHSRMDRVKNIDEVFTLKYFCQVINDLGFDQVNILDPHSNVTPALLDRVSLMAVEPLIKRALDLCKADYVYFPDEGAMKRYGDMVDGKQLLTGHKKRDWGTGKIVGLEITGTEGQTFEEGHFMGCSVLMVDDIISYGGTLAYSADELKRLGFKHIYAYATHTENSILDEEKGTLLKRLNDGTVDMIYTTDSLYSGNHEKITVL